MRPAGAEWEEKGGKQLHFVLRSSRLLAVLNASWVQAPFVFQVSTRACGHAYFTTVCGLAAPCHFLPAHLHFERRLEAKVTGG